MIFINKVINNKSYIKDFLQYSNLFVNLFFVLYNKEIYRMPNTVKIIYILYDIT